MFAMYISCPHLGCYRELKLDASKLQEKLADQSRSLENAVADLEQLTVDLDTVTESADRLGAQAKELANVNQPVTCDSLAALLSQCQV